MTNPLGQYGDTVAAFLAVIIVAAAIASHLVPGLAPDSFLDNVALLVAGVIFGTSAGKNGTAVVAQAALSAATAAHTRLDAISAPSTMTAAEGPHGPAPLT